MTRFQTSALLVATIAGLTLSSPGRAEVTADEIGKRLSNLIERQSFKLTWDSIDGSAGDFVMRGVRSAATQGGAATVLGDLPLHNVTEIDGGDYRIGEVEFPVLMINREGVNITMSDVVLEGVLLTGANSTDPMAGIMFSERGRMGEVTATKRADVAFRLTNLNYAAQRSNGGWDNTYSASAERFSSDLSMAKDPQVLTALTALQLLQINGRMEMRGSMSLKSGRSRIDQFDITFDNQGKIGMTADIGGYTREFYDALSQIQQSTLNATPEQAQAQGLAMFGLMQQLTLSGASLRYDDASFAMRALEMAAATQNARAADLPGTAQMLLPMMLGQYLPADMVQQVTTEVVKFLGDPRNIEIRLSPAQPVPMMSLAGAAADPKAVAATLGLTVKANQ